jgi:lipid A 3-O-deacylase
MIETRLAKSSTLALLAGLALAPVAYGQTGTYDPNRPANNDLLTQYDATRDTPSLPPDAAPADLPPYAKGTWAFQTYASATVGEDDGALYLGHFGAGYFVLDGLSLNFEVVFGVARAQEQAGERGDVFPTAGFDLLARWHVLRGERWSFYLEGGAGVLQSSQSFPAHGTHFNFTPQAGLGFTFNVTDDVQLMLGSRWHHISNANIFSNDRNPGYDGIMFYGGIMIPF